MSKSIYEIASRRIHDMFDSWDRGVYQDSVEIIEEALQQANKSKRIIRHYKDLAEVRKELYDLTINFKQSNKDRMIILFTQEITFKDISGVRK